MRVDAPARAGRVAVDGRDDTAWRCDGDGIGHALVIDLGTVRTIDGVGIVPGYAKTDPADGTDRYAQDRRISVVRYAFDDGTTVTQNLDTDPAHRAPQWVAFPAERTEHVVVLVLSSVPGSEVNGQPAVDKVAISEVTVTDGPVPGA